MKFITKYDVDGIQHLPLWPSSIDLGYDTFFTTGALPASSGKWGSKRPPATKPGLKVLMGCTAHDD